MRRLRKQARQDRLHTELRSNRGRAGRWIYLGLLGLLLIWLINLFMGDLLYLSAEGMVTRERQAVSLSFPAVIKQLAVREGDRVRAGDLLVSVDSLPVIQDVANLSARLAEFRARHQELMARRLVIAETLPVAREHARAINDLLSSREGALREGLTTNLTLHELFQADYANRKEVAELMAERDALDQEAQELDAIIADFTASLEQLRTQYGQGAVRAPEQGIVAELQVNVGSSTGQSGRLMDLLVGQTHVLAYIRPGALYEVRVGDPVGLRYGVREISGTVSEVLPLTVQMPAEFQRSFQPRERSQIIRIQIEDEQIPPMFTKVTVRSSRSWLAQAKRLVGSLLRPSE